MDRRRFVAGISAGLGVLGGCLSPIQVDSTGQHTRTSHQSHDVGPETTLRVDNPNGSVTVRGYDGETAEVDIEIQGPSKRSVEAVSVTADRSDGQLALVTEYTDPGPERASVSLQISYPKGSSVGRIGTDNGAITIRNVAGDPELRSQNGRLAVSNVDGTVALSTNNGTITARNIGAIGHATTSNGSIEVDVPSVSDDVTVRTTNGAIDAALAQDLDATVSATTSNSPVQLHGLDLSERNGPTTVSGTLGSGTHTLTFETSNGTIDLRMLSA